MFGLGSLVGGKGSTEVLCWNGMNQNSLPVGDRQSEFHELALTGRYCHVHLASVQFGRGYEPIDLPYSVVYRSIV